MIGNVKLMTSGKWDGGWIYDPEKDSKYDVEITQQSDQKLKVMGYAGVKFLSETMIRTRAPADLQRCGSTPSRAPLDPVPATTPQEKVPPVTCRPSIEAEECRACGAQGDRRLPATKGGRRPAGVFRKPSVVQTGVAGRLVPIDEQGALSTFSRNITLQRAGIEENIFAVQSRVSQDHNCLLWFSRRIEHGQGSIGWVILEPILALVPQFGEQIVAELTGQPLRSIGKEGSHG